jgi:hypothetical protein
MTTAEQAANDGGRLSSAAPAFLTPRALTFSLGHLPDEVARYGPDP